MKKNIKIILIICIVGSACLYAYFNTKKDENFYNQLEEASNITKSDETKTEKIIIVHISGEVNNPGIVKLKEGDRIINAIELAGGITEYANLDEVNLAYVLKDGQKIYIPNLNETEENIIQENGDNIIKDEDTKTNAKININNAKLEDLQLLDGIGDSTARKIIEYRKENGKFKSIEDLKNISGIGENKFNLIKEKVCI